VLDDKGAPTPVERTLVRPPCSRIGPLTPQERTVIRSMSPIGTKYDTLIDRESAHEILGARAQAAATAAAQAQAQLDARKAAEAQAKEQARAEREAAAHPGFAEQVTRQLGKSVQRSLINRVGGALVRGLLGGLFRGR
jgi:DNA helicase HerA-like ATPase